MLSISSSSWFEWKLKKSSTEISVRVVNKLKHLENEQFDISKINSRELMISRRIPDFIFPSYRFSEHTEEMCCLSFVEKSNCLPWNQYHPKIFDVTCFIVLFHHWLFIVSSNRLKIKYKKKTRKFIETDNPFEISKGEAYHYVLHARLGCYIFHGINAVEIRQEQAKKHMHVIHVWGDCFFFLLFECASACGDCIGIHDGFFYFHLTYVCVWSVELYVWAADCTFSLAFRIEFLRVGKKITYSQRATVLFRLMYVKKENCTRQTHRTQQQ